MLYSVRSYKQYLLIGILPLAEVFAERDLVCMMLTLCLTILFMALYLFTARLSKRIIANNIYRINDTLAAIEAGKLETRAQVEGSVELQALSHGINSMVEALRRAIAAETARLDEELAYARSAQRSALPAPLAKTEDFSVAAQIYPAKMVGGDFYDFYRLDEGHLAFLIGDVCDKGVSGALYMMRAKSTVKELLLRGMPLEDAAGAANARLFEKQRARHVCNALARHTGYKKRRDRLYQRRT